MKKSAPPTKSGKPAFGGKNSNKGSFSRKPASPAKSGKFDNNSKRDQQPKQHYSKPQQNKPAGLKLALYGMHAVTAAWLNPKRNIHALYVTDAQHDMAGLLAKKAREAGLNRPEPMRVDAARLDASLPGGSAHQGIAIGSSPLDQPSLEEVLENLGPDQPATLVMLDQVTDPHNIGAILRSVAAFGGTAIILQSRHAPEPGAVMGKTACGALEIVPICYEVNLSRSLEMLADYGFVSLGFDERGEHVIGDLKPADMPRKVLVMGAEGEGLRRLVRDHCTHLVRLPTTAAMPSLNVSNATAVALYALQKD